MLTVGSATLSTWDVPRLRQRLAPALTFTRRYHARPYTLATLPTEIGARVEPISVATGLDAYTLARQGQRVILVSECMGDDLLYTLAVLHECSHQITGLHLADCTARMEARDERDAWIASAIVGVSRELATMVIDGKASAAEVADRCRVPEPLVMVRLGLMFVLGEKRGRLASGLDAVRFWLRRLEDWIVRARNAAMWRRTA